MPNRSQSTGGGIERILQDPKYAGKFILKDMLPVKMSAVILDFAKPLLDKIDLTNKSVTEKTIQKAIEIWNYLIVIDMSYAESGVENRRMYILGMAGVAKQKFSSRISRKDYFELVERKEALYPDNYFFIIEHSVRWSEEESQMYLSVLTNDASKVKR